MPASVRLVLVLVTLGIAVAACRSSGEDALGGPFDVQDVALDVTPTGDAFVPTLDGPLRLLAITPRGATTVRHPGISATFSRPMVPLGEAPEPSSRWLTVTTAEGASVRGDLAWHGTQTLVFTPRETLARATAYTVRLASGIPDLEGEVMDEGATWEFETARPRLIGSTPAGGESHAMPEQAIELRFDQPVRARDARDHLRVTVDGDARAVRVSNANDSTLLVRPGDRLDHATRYRVTVEAGLTGTSGPLPMKEDRSFTFRTYGDLRLERVTQEDLRYRRDTTRFDPAEGIQVVLTNPVSFQALRQSIRLSPAATLPAGAEARDASESSGHTLAFPLKPETRYTLTIRDLKDVFGQTLDSTTVTFQTGPYDPSLSVPSGRLIIEAEERPAIPVRATNVENVRVGMRRLAEDEIVPALIVYDGYWRYCRGECREEDQPAPVAARDTMRIPLARNQPGTVALSLRKRLNGATGVVAVNMDSDHLGRNDRGERVEWNSRAIAQVTRLGLTAKFSPHQQLVLVSTLADARPVRGARITVRDIDNRVLWRGETGAGGRASVPGWEELGVEKPDRWQSPMLFVLAEKDGDVTFTSSLYTDGLEPYRFDVDGDWSPDVRTTAGTVFSDRGLYKSGETVHLKGLLRTRTDGDWRSARDSARVLVRSPRDEVVLDRRLAPGDWGSFDLDWAAPADASQGLYTVAVHATTDTTVNDRWSGSQWAEGSFRVESFRRASFAVTPTTSASGYVAGDFFEGMIEGRYLFGAPMGGQPVTYSLRESAGEFAPTGFGAFRFGPLDTDWGSSEIVREAGTLGADGEIRHRVRLGGDDSGAPKTLTWEGTVTDPSRQEQSSRATLTLHPATFYVGLRVGSTYLDAREDRDMRLDVVTVDPAGAPVGGKEVTVEMVREQWNSVREVGQDGRLRWRSEKTETVVGRQRVTTRAGRMARVTLPVAEGGAYRLRATATDERGNAVVTEAFFYAAGRGYSAWERSDDDRIDLIPETTEYAPGETAKLLVQSPYERATALITVEREGVISSRVEELVGTSPQIEVELDERHMPNAFVSVVLLSGRTARPGATADPGAPQFKMGLVELRVDPGARRLTVEVEPNQEEYRPGEDVVVDLTLVDSRGRGVAGEIAFSAADAGVLNLVNYALPDPFDTFYGPRPLGVQTAVTLSDLVRQRSYGQKEEDLGGGGGDPDDLLRRDFRPQAHWDPSVRTNERGRARVTFRVPESLTTFRLMATAHTPDHRFGSGRRDVTVTQPLVLQPALPRFARLGDTFEAGVLVSNRTDRAGEAVVDAEADAGLALTGAKAKRVPLAPNQTREVRFAWRVDRAGAAPEVRFQARMGDERDGLAVPLSVAAPSARTTTATFASTDGRASEALRLPADAIASLGGLRVSVASTALVGLDGASRYLFQYPYGCLEQRTSRVRPLLVGRELMDAYDLDALDGNADREVQKWLADLDGFWTGDGFALWTGGTHANPYVSAYAVLALAEAAEAGYDVPQSLTRESVEGLARWVRNKSARPDFYNESVWSDTRALMLYALARHGEHLVVEMDALSREGGLSTEGASLLLRASVEAGARSQAPLRRSLRERIEGQVRVEATTAYIDHPESDGWGWIFASDERATAYALAALVEAAPGDDTRQIGERMIRYLMQAQEGGHWRSTQDNAAVVDAFRVFSNAFEGEMPDFAAEVDVAGRALLRQAFRGRSLEVAEESRSLTGLPRGQDVPIAIAKNGAGRAYYQLVLETYSAAPQPARAQGLTVSRSIQPLDSAGQPDGAPLSSTDARVTAGQLLRVTIRLRTPTSRSYVVVDDALPAGLEALNTALDATPSAASAQTGNARWWGSFNHTEIRDDRVLLFADWLASGEHTYTYLARATTPGAFVHPPAQAEAMYSPEVMGRTASGRLTVAL